MRDPLPPPGAPIDLAQAARLFNAYLPGMRTELRAAVETIRRNHPGAPLHVHEWRPAEIVAQWSPALGRVLVGSVMADLRANGGSFTSVTILIDKASGELVVQDDSGLLV